MRFGKFILIALCLFSFGIQVAFATDVTRIDGGHWKHTRLENELTEEVDTVIIYFHGSGNTGNTLGDLSVLMGKKAADGPTKYATTITYDWLPKGVVIVCPQAHNDKDFHESVDEIFCLIEEYNEKYPDAKLVLAGHSNGAMMIFNLAYQYGTDIADGWVFISGKSSKGYALPSDSTNIMVASGTGEINSKIGLARRSDFENLFYSPLGTSETAWREEDTNNAYIVGDWTHGQTPRVFLEDFFWEWIKDV